MRLLVVSESYPPLMSGVAIMAQILAQAATNKGFETSVITAQDSAEQNSDIKNLSIYKLKGQPNPFRPGYKFNFTAPGKLKDLLKKIDPQVIHFHDPAITSLQVARLAKDIPKLYTNHGSSKFVLSYFPNAFRNEHTEKLVWNYFSWFGNQCQMVTTPTNTVLKILMERGLHVPGRAVSNGINLKEFYPLAKQDAKNKLRDNLSWPRDKFIFYYHGRIDPDKHLDILIKGLPQAAEAYPNIHLVISGGPGKTKTELESLAIELKVDHHITWTDPHLDERIKEYQSADCFVISSVIETQSLVTLQALAVGLPVVAADALALPELVKPGINGWLFEADSLPSYFKAISKVLEASKSDLRKMSQESLKIAQSHDQKQTIKEYLKIYEKLAID